MISLHFLHTNDMHSHFDNWGSLVSYLNRERQQLREEGDPYLTLDLGDHMDRYNPMTEGLLGEGNVRLLNDANYDFVTIGNNEGITFTKDILNAVYQKRKFEVILANLYDLTGERPPWCKPYAVCDMRGVKVGLIGLTAAFPKFYHLLGWDIHDPFSELRPLVAQLRQETDLIVLMSHVGLPFDERVAEEIDGIDVIIGSHTHHVLEEGLMIDSTLIAQAGKYGRYAGHVVVEYDEEAHQVVHKGADLVTLREQPDQEAQREVQQLTAEGIENMQQKIAWLDHPVQVNWYKETALPLILADALRKWCHADIGLVNAGVIIEGLPAGAVTRYDVHHICPHPINPCKVEITGKEIVEIINIGLKKQFQTYELKGFGFRGKVLGKLVFSHLTYETHLRNGILEASDVRVQGVPLLIDKRYSIGTIDVFTLGTFLPPIVRAKQQFYLPEMLRDLLAWRLKELN
ncbi:bifunctional metallophosphatase/5'-nucleotidase [Sporolactobacillus pectinivorans]|uniref:bifunctional metallophosphatase/5'-nucleotidase n=1 Tax=Sporolactobacillus pectinivorans TaxID=1591408 RepID=UPI000C25B9EE|nr:bifunctional UDP-sugar hydrolase/5'-nucleotidase [Sporolactobacillus pectinivorans]